MSGWADMIDDDNIGSSTTVMIPQDEVIQLKPNIQQIIQFAIDNTDKNNPRIIRNEKIVQIIKQQKRVSKSAQKRRDSWVKFGNPVKNVPKGTIEDGVTTIRKEEWPFKWNEQYFGKVKKKTDNKILKPKLNFSKLKMKVDMEGVMYLYGERIHCVIYPYISIWEFNIII